MINVLLETWCTDNSNPSLDGFTCFNLLSRKVKKAGHGSGGISVFVKNDVLPGISRLKSHTHPCYMWLKLDKFFFGMAKDLFLCAVYAPPEGSPYAEDIFTTLENDVTTLSLNGNTLIMGDLNARTGELKDYIAHDSSSFLPLPENYREDDCQPRRNMDKKTNKFGEKLIDLCITGGLRILNGRTVGDLLGSCTCYQPLGASTVDYGIANLNLLPLINSFQNRTPSIFSDHSQLIVSLMCRKTSAIPVNLNALPCKFSWTSESLSKLINILTTDGTMRNILFLQTTHVPHTQLGIDEVVNRTSSLPTELSSKVCRVQNKNRKKQKNHGLEDP